MRFGSRRWNRAKPCFALLSAGRRMGFLETPNVCLGDLGLPGPEAQDDALSDVTKERDVLAEDAQMLLLRLSLSLCLRWRPRIGSFAKSWDFIPCNELT